mmetsp:Transcript_75919/g.217360  ORF Transcript_75919/g.217360 Transcript_75919/m.217360 type:complete len:200 (+) Transcript_75919:433-1032(+)
MLGTLCCLAQPRNYGKSLHRWALCLLPVWSSEPRTGFARPTTSSRQRWSDYSRKSARPGATPTPGASPAPRPPCDCSCIAWCMAKMVEDSRRTEMTRTVFRSSCWLARPMAAPFRFCWTRRALSSSAWASRSVAGILSQREAPRRACCTPHREYGTAPRASGLWSLTAAVATGVGFCRTFTVTWGFWIIWEWTALNSPP